MAKARAPLGMIAVAGILGAHWAAYLFAAPDPHDRAHLLETSGHAYWPLAAMVAIAAAAFGLVTFVGSRIHPSIVTSRRAILSHSLPRFLGLQVGGFALLEISERVLSGHSFGTSDLLATTFVAGVVIQVIAAILSALLLVGIAFVVERIVRRRPAKRRVAGPIRTVTTLVSVPAVVPATGSHTLRGPPVVA